MLGLGARSYYPLFCTIAQTDQFFDLHHRSGNVHDSNGAPDFIKRCFQRLRERVPAAQFESRVDSAFFNDTVFPAFEEHHVLFSCSVPFERFVVLKEMIEERKRWRRIDSAWSYFETEWKPDCWSDTYRCIFVRQRKPTRHKGPLQLDLFEPRDFEYDYRVIATNKTDSAKNVILLGLSNVCLAKLSGFAISVLMVLSSGDCEINGRSSQGTEIAVFFLFVFFSERSFSCKCWDSNTFSCEVAGKSTCAGQHSARLHRFCQRQAQARSSDRPDTRLQMGDAAS